MKKERTMIMSKYGGWSGNFLSVAAFVEGAIWVSLGGENGMTK
jgi:hypothetical protein